MKVNNKYVDHAFKDDIVEIKLDKKIKLDSIVVKTTDNSLVNEIDDILKNNRKIKIDGKITCMLNTAPKFFGAAPFVADQNVSTMMTVLTSLSGFVVVFSMCIPFNKYRGIALGAIAFVALVLGLMLPSAFLCGQPMGGSMFAFDANAGQTFFDSQFMHELFQPMNSPAVRDLMNDGNNFIVLRLFLYVAIPSFILIRFAVANISQANDPERRKRRVFRFGRRLMLSCGL